MDKTIQTILNELYMLDPSLKDQERAVAALVEKMIAAKPDIKLDTAFVRTLREQLVAPATSSVSATSGISYVTYTFMQKFLFAIGGAAIALAIAIPLTFLTVRREASISPLATLTEQDQENRGASVSAGKDLGMQAFGSLAQGSNDAMPSGEGMESKMMATAPAAGFGGGGGGSNAGIATDRMIMPPYQQPIVNQYRYSGDTLPENEATVEVLRREKDLINGGTITSAFTSIDLGLIPLRQFNNTKVQMFTLNQEHPYGYQVTVDLTEGSVTIGKNWQRWPQVSCSDQACWEAQRVRQSDIPDDQTLMRIADDFVTKMSINKSAYTSPEVDRSWETWYAQAEDKANYYFPEQVTVRYPLLVDGKRVYEQYGEPVGMMVSIDVRERKAAGAYNIMTQQYSRSGYPTEQDQRRIITIAEKGGSAPWFMPYMAEDGSTKIVDVSLGTPAEGYMRYWQQGSATPRELLVPALIFPVEDAPQEYTGNRNIVVPLVKEILDEIERNNQGGPQMMPLERSMSLPASIPATEPVMRESD